MRHERSLKVLVLGSMIVVNLMDGVACNDININWKCGVRIQLMQREDVVFFL
jgi:hypothetical protein